MAQEERTKAERVERLRRRLAEAYVPPGTAALVAVLKGILDLLADEL